MDPIQLFGGPDLAHESPTFELRGQRTIVAVGMAEGDYITFEVLVVSEGLRAKICGCVLTQAMMSQVTGVEELQCPACEELTQRPVRVTPQNPIVVLDYPQDTLLRAIYHGTGINDRTVVAWATTTNTPYLTDTLRGCPPIYYPEEDQTWTDTGQFRCLADQTTIEYEQVNDCGRRRWFPDPERPQIWVDTCCIRCLPDETTVEVQQVNQCGDLRWAASDIFTQTWTETGDIRCFSGDGGDVIEAEEVNQCGDHRWVITERVMIWVDTGSIRCLDDESSVEVEQINDCGQRRWIFSENISQIWQPSGVHRCTNEGMVEIQEVNQCGQLRWNECGEVEWTPTGKIRCFPGPGGEGGDGTFEIEETNQCGHRRWVEESWLEWTDTANVRCSEDSSLVEVEQTSPCGDRRWVDAGYSQDWVETGVARCVDGIAEHQEVNQCGRLRWSVTGLPCETVTPTAPSVHSILSITPSAPSITEGANACWDVVLNTPVAGTDLTINFTLSGAEQSAHGYPAPSLVIGVGNSIGSVCVTTNDDAIDELTLQLCLTALTSGRVLAVPAASCIDVLDNDDPVGGDSTHTVVSVTVLPVSGVEGTQFCWTVTVDAPVVGSPLPLTSVLSGAEFTQHGYASPVGSIPVGMTSGTLCVTTNNDAIVESDKPLCLTVLTGPRITAVPAAVCATVTDDGDTPPPATLPPFLGGACFVDSPNTSISEFYVTFLSSGDMHSKTMLGFQTDTWLPPGQSSSDYEVMVVDTSDPALTAAGAARGVWHNLGTTRDFRWQIFGPSPSAGYVSDTIHIRRVGEVVDDDTVQIDPGTFVSVGVECP